MDFLFDLLTLPFELIGGSMECLFGCLALSVFACCCSMVLMFVVIS